MARTWNADNDELTIASVPLTGVPLSVFARFKIDDITDFRTIFHIGDASTSNNYFRLDCRGGDGGDPLVATTRDVGNVQWAASTTGYSADTWHTGLAVFAAINDRRVYLDGGNKGTNTTSITPTGVDKMSIGRSSDSSPSGHWRGSICEVCMWDVALSDAEALALHLAIKPNHIRPADVVGYWPVWGLHSPEIDLSGQGNNMTVSNTPVRGNHGPAGLFTPNWAAGVPLIEVAAGGGFAHT